MDELWKKTISIPAIDRNAFVNILAPYKDDSFITIATSDRFCIIYPDGKTTELDTTLNITSIPDLTIIELKTNCDLSKIYIYTNLFVRIFSFADLSNPVDLPNQNYNKLTIFSIDWASYSPDYIAVSLKSNEICLINVNKPEEVVKKIKQQKICAITWGDKSNLWLKYAIVYSTEQNGLKITRPFISPDYKFSNREYTELSASLNAKASNQLQAMFVQNGRGKSIDIDVCVTSDIEVSTIVTDHISSVIWTNDRIIALSTAWKVYVFVIPETLYVDNSKINAEKLSFVSITTSFKPQLITQMDFSRMTRIWKANIPYIVHNENYNEEMPMSKLYALDKNDKIVLNAEINGIVGISNDPRFALTSQGKIKPLVTLSKEVKTTEYENASPQQILDAANMLKNADLSGRLFRLIEREKALNNKQNMLNSRLTALETYLDKLSNENVFDLHKENIAMTKEYAESLEERAKSVLNALSGDGAYLSPAHLNLKDRLDEIQQEIIRIRKIVPGLTEKTENGIVLSENQLLQETNRMCLLSSFAETCHTKKSQKVIKASSVE